MKKAAVKKRTAKAAPPAVRNRIATTIRIDTERLGRLKLLAMQQRRRVNDVLLDAIDAYLAAHKQDAA